MLSFEDATDETDDDQRIVLLGNGFSIDCSSEFRYDSLYDQAKLAGLTVDKAELFDALSTRNFEDVVQHLDRAADLLDVYDDSSSFGDLRDRYLDDADIVRRGLADVIADTHPSDPGHLDWGMKRHASHFLSHFTTIYTVNYDLLLYWVLNSLSARNLNVPYTDGFGRPGGQSLLTWSSARAEDAEVFYLHGALNLYVHKQRLRKLEQSDGASVQQVRDRILDGKYPKMVTEGNTDQKAERIARSAYLRDCHEALQRESGALFVHGHSLHPNDRHILRRIARSSISTVYISAYPADDHEAVQLLRDRVEALHALRKKTGKPALTVKLYDAASAHVWRD